MTVKSESGDPVLSLKKYANYEDFSLSNFGEILHTRLFEFLEKGHNPTITGWREKKKNMGLLFFIQPNYKISRTLHIPFISCINKCKQSP